jgi:hypothetical protein
MVAFKDDILRTKEIKQGSTYIGIVNGITGKSGQVSVRFMNGIQKSMKVKDLNVT